VLDGGVGGIILNTPLEAFRQPDFLIAPDHPLLEQRFVWYAAAT
jgi:hypothetical protein